MQIFGCASSKTRRLMALLRSLSAPASRNASPIVSSFLGHRACSVARPATRALSVNTDKQQQIALVQGASRGLGLEYVRQLLSRPGQK